MENEEVLCYDDTQCYGGEVNVDEIFRRMSCFESCYGLYSLEFLQEITND